MMRAKLFILLFLCVGSVMSYAQNSTFQELVNKKQFETVIARADSLTPADSADYAVMSALGQAYEGMLRYKDAYRCYQYCLSMDTANLDAWNALARAAQNYGKVGEAQRCYSKVLETDSMNFYANLQMARLAYQLGEYGKATEYYHTLNEIEYENPLIITGLADCHIKRNTGPNTMIAALLYQTAFRLNPENTRIASSLINTLMTLRSTKDALLVCDTALMYNPDNRAIRQSQAMALYMERNYLKADSVYSGLLAAGDSSFLTLKYTGASRYMSGHAMDAIEPLQLAYEMDSSEVETALLLGAALGKTYDRKRAYQLFDQAEANMKPKQFLVDLLITSKGQTYQRDGRREEAEKLYYKAWKENPRNLIWLNKILSAYGLRARDEERDQRDLFLINLYIREYLKTDKPAQSFAGYRPFLESKCEEAFFKSVDALPVIAPDGKKSKIKVSDLRDLLNQLPEMTEKERKSYDHVKKFMNEEEKRRKIRMEESIKKGDQEKKQEKAGTTR